MDGILSSPPRDCGSFILDQPPFSLSLSSGSGIWMLKKGLGLCIRMLRIFKSSFVGAIYTAPFFITPVVSLKNVPWTSWAKRKENLFSC